MAQDTPGYAFIVALIVVLLIVWVFWVIGQCLAVLLHETGHWVAARIMGKKNCGIVVGGLKHDVSAISSLRMIHFGTWPWNKGFTHYTPPPRTMSEVLWIAGSGPMVSGLLSFSGGILAWLHVLPITAWIVVAPLWLANVRVLAVSLWPGPLVADKHATDAPHPESDVHYILQQIQQFRSRKRPENS